jgi:hypothetical protein
MTSRTDTEDQLVELPAIGWFAIAAVHGLNHRLSALRRPPGMVDFKAN